MQSRFDNKNKNKFHLPLLIFWLNTSNPHKFKILSNISLILSDRRDE